MYQEDGMTSEAEHGNGAMVIVELDGSKAKVEPERGAPSSMIMEGE